MNSTETSSDPRSNSAEHSDELQAGIDDLDSRNADEVSLAAIAGVVANMNEKICLLRREILELRDCGKVSVVRKSAQIKSGNPSGSAPEDQRTVRNLGLGFVRKIMPLAFFERTILRRSESKESTSDSKLSTFSNSIKDLLFKSETQSGRRRVYVVGAEPKSRSASPFEPGKDSKIRKELLCGGSTDAVSENVEIADRKKNKRLNERKKIDNKGKRKDAALRKIRNIGSEISDADNNDGNETMNTSDNCLSDEIACVKRKREEKRIGQRENAAPVEPIKLNKCLNTKCYGKRVRKRISRGVQTVPKKRCKIVNLLRKFRWGSRKKRRKEKVSAVRETPSQRSSADMILEPRGASPRTQEDNTRRNIESYDVTSETNDERKRERKQRSNDLQARNQNRKYEMSIDGEKVGTIRTEKKDRITTRENPRENHKLPGHTPETTEKRSALREKKKNATNNRGGQDKRKENNLSSSDVGTSDRISKPRPDKSKPRESVTQKTEPIDKTETDREGKVSRKMNNESKATRLKKKNYQRDINAAEQPAASTRTKRSRNRKIPLTSKAFTADNARNSTQQPPSLDDKKQEMGNELIDERLDGWKTDIADVKRRLDACIDDLNDIIFTLSDLFRDGSTSGGPAGEGTQSEYGGRSSRRGRSHFR